MATLTVGSGSGFGFQTLSSAIAAAQDGDVIQVQAGTYTNDFATIDRSITIEGVGGLVNLVATVPPPNDKAILTIGGPGEEPNVTLENISFSGAAISNDLGGNAAGIRYQSGDLTLDHTYFYNNQDGLLGDADASGTITIENSAFIGNGNANPPSGVEHNLYVGVIAQLTVDNSYFDNPIVGHDIKSRAMNNIIENSRIYDTTGSGSYEIDIPNGGNTVIQNNVIEKAAGAGAGSFIAIGEEGNVNTTSTLVVSGNTVISTYDSALFVANDTTTGADVTGNAFYGVNSGQVIQGPAGTIQTNSFSAIASAPTLDSSAPYLPVIPFSFACFAAGTRIATPDGPVAVESLSVGQSVTVLQPQRGSAAIKWIGSRRISLDRHIDRISAAPIRISTDAFADGAPCRDLFLSPDHAIHVGGRLIPIRLLVNGATIRRDDHMQSIHYFHIELDHHSTVLAEGLEVESYLDTGNRTVFENDPGAIDLHPDMATVSGQPARESLSCAPFEAGAAHVERMWRRLAIRASQLGHVIPEPRITKDPMVRLWTDEGWLWPQPAPAGGLRFTPAGGAKSMLLVSRATAPCDVRPWVEDRRTLGVAITAIRMVTRSGVVELQADHPSLADGWWPAEDDGQNVWRWTAGRARLPVWPDVLSLDLLMTGETPYLMDDDDPMPALRSVA
jgi:hypothetical protein